MKKKFKQEKTWQLRMHKAYSHMIAAFTDDSDSEHYQSTPTRVVKALSEEMFCGYQQDPESILRVFKEDGYDEMVAVCNVEFVSFCAHHVLPFVGKAHFAYIPNGKIVGLSKIPRLIHAYSRRLQVQERLCGEIVDMFMKQIEPKGCGIVMEAMHTCMSVRGVRQAGAVTKTSALRGVFKQTEVKSEFLSFVANAKRVEV